MDTNQLIYLIPLIPLIGCIINGLGRNVISKPVIGIIGSLVVLASFCLSVGVFISTTQTGFIPQTFRYFDFIHVGKLSIPFEFQIDQLTSVFLLIITGVGFVIHVYSTAYMKDETPSGYGRYFSYLNLFVFSMLLLVMGGNYVIMYMGWEGVGLCSYLLIGFWFKDHANNDAGNKAFIMNRVGDVGFLLAVFWMISAFGTTSYHELYNTENGIISSFTDLNSPVIVGITLLLFLGAVGKTSLLIRYTNNVFLGGKLE